MRSQNTIDFIAEAEVLRAELIARRRDLHQHPELAFEEVRTSGIVANELQRLGMEVQTGVGRTGVVGILEGAHDGPTILVRADMDALPIHEETRAEYCSLTSGKMHACGHDGHVAIGLGVAQLLTNHRDQLKGRVKFVFQPAEEIARGACAMVDDGVLTEPRPDVTLGLHLWTGLPLGILGIADGAVMASASIFNLIIHGRGGHGGMPDQTIDPIVCAAHVISTLQTIVSRNLHPLDSAVLSVTRIHAGEANNVIPQSVEIGGTLRAYKTEVRDLVKKRMAEITQSLCAAMGCTCELEITDLTIPVFNDAGVSERARQVFAKLIGPEKLEKEYRVTVSEDVSLLMNDIPGLFFFLGAANTEKGFAHGHHHPLFDFDEDALPLGTALLAAAVADYVLAET